MALEKWTNFLAQPIWSKKLGCIPINELISFKRWINFTDWCNSNLKSKKLGLAKFHVVTIRVVNAYPKPVFFWNFRTDP